MDDFFQIDSSSQTILLVQLCIFNVVNQLVGQKICPEIDHLKKFVQKLITLLKLTVKAVLHNVNIQGLTSLLIDC